MENRVLFLKMKDKMQKDEILMPKSKAPSKKEDSLSLPNHIGSSNNLAYLLPPTHPPFILLRGITNLPTNQPIPFTNYSYILTVLLITIITPFSYISNNQVPINTHPFKTTLSSRLKFASINFASIKYKVEQPMKNK